MDVRGRATFACGTGEGGARLFCQGAETYEVRVGPDFCFGPSSSEDICVRPNFHWVRAEENGRPRDALGGGACLGTPIYLARFGEGYQNTRNAIFIRPEWCLGGAQVSGHDPSVTSQFAFEAGVLLGGWFAFGVTWNPDIPYVTAVPAGLGTRPVSAGISMAIGSPPDLTERRAEAPQPMAVGPAVVGGEVKEVIYLRVGRPVALTMSTYLPGTRDPACTGCGASVDPKTLPPGLSIPTGTMRLEGTPTKLDTYNMKVTVTGGGFGKSTTFRMTIVVEEAGGGVSAGGAGAATFPTLKVDPATSPDGAFTASVSGRQLTIKGPDDIFAGGTILFEDRSGGAVTIDKGRIRRSTGEVVIEIDARLVNGKVVVNDVSDIPQYEFRLVP